jgi:plasmid stabilization system protein ParE
MKVRYTPRARDDLVAILEYLKERSPKGAEHVKRAIARTIELIGQYPESGPRSDEQQSRVLPVGSILTRSTEASKPARHGSFIFVKLGEGRGLKTRIMTPACS